ncbi:regulator [Brevibacillus agri]|uniref:regulator n=1 Tax=Brevibacillus agri TaxID=51101 RepID=UPI003D229F78
MWNGNHAKAWLCSSLALVLAISGSVQAQQLAAQTAPAQKQAIGSKTAAEKARQVPMKACGEDEQKAGQKKPAANSLASLDEASASPLSGIRKIATGVIFDEAGYGWRPGISYAIDQAGNAWRWGVQAGQWLDFPQKLAGIENVKEVTWGYALTNAGEVWRLGEQAQPEKIAGLDHIRSIRELIGNEEILALLKDDGTVWTLKQGERQPRRLGSFAKVSALYGSAFSLFLQEESGKLFYLDGKRQELKAELAHVVDVPGAVKQIALDYSDRAMIQTANDEVYLFNAKEKTWTRAPREADEAVKMAVGGDGLYLFSKKDGTLWGWGHNTLGMLGEQYPDRVELPVRIADLTDIVDVQAGTDHILALQKSGHVFSWGSNMTGQLGRMPRLFTEWTEIGELKDVRQIATGLGQPYFVRKDGTVWGIDEQRQPYQVAGPKNVQTIDSVLNAAVTLDTAGHVQLWTDQFGTCQTLALPGTVKDVVAGEERLLLRLADDGLFAVELRHELVEKNGVYVPANITVGEMEAAQIDPAVAARIAKLYANAYLFFATTKEGEVLYAEQTARQPSFQSVPGVKGVRELAPQYFVRYTADPLSVWALSDAGAVRELQFQLDRHKDEWNIAQVSVAGEAEEGIAFASGRLRITKDGQLYEKDWSPLVKKQIPRPVRLVASTYDYAIEGPGSHYHVIVTEDDKVVVLGYNPFEKSSLQPQLVQTKAKP